MGNNTCSLEMKGEGCREFERNNPDKTWKQFLVFLRGAYDARASRVDIAVDDFSGDVITFDYIEDKLRRKMFTSSFKKSPCVGGNDEEGKSYTFGKRKVQELICSYVYMKSIRNKYPKVKKIYSLIGHPMK